MLPTDDFLAYFDEDCASDGIESRPYRRKGIRSLIVISGLRPSLIHRKVQPRRIALSKPAPPGKRLVPRTAALEALWVCRKLYPWRVNPSLGPYDYTLREYQLYVDGKPTRQRVILNKRDVTIINQTFADDPMFDGFSREYREVVNG